MGTPYYMAPEILNKSPDDVYCDSCDIWSLGVCFYFMLFWRIPFGPSLNK